MANYRAVWVVRPVDPNSGRLRIGNATGKFLDFTSFAAGTDTQRFKFDDTGHFTATAGITLSAFNVAGVVHNSSAGVFSSSLVVAADLAANTITGAQLARGSTNQVLWSQDNAHDPAFTGSPILSTSLTVGAAAAGTGVLTLSNGNTTFDLATATPHLTLANTSSSAGQTVFLFSYAGTVKAGWRGDFAGNVNYHAVGYHQFYNGIGITGPIANLSSAGLAIGSAAGGASTAQLDVIASGASKIAAILKGASSQTANFLEARDSTNAVKAALQVGGKLRLGDGTAATEVLEVVGNAAITGLNAGGIVRASVTTGKLVIGTVAFTELTGIPTTLSGYGITDAVPSTRTVTAGAGLTGGGALSANITVNVVANADGSIIVNADDIQVGIVAWGKISGTPTTLSGYGITDAVPAGRTLTGTAPVKIDGVSTAVDLSANRTISVLSATTGAVGVVQLAGDFGGTATAPTVVGITGTAGPAAIHASSLAIDETVTFSFFQTQSTVGPGRKWSSRAQRGFAGSIGGIYEIGGGDGGTGGSDSAGDTYVQVGQAVSGVTASVRIRSLTSDVLTVSQSASGVAKIGSGESIISFGKPVQVDQLAAPALTGLGGLLWTSNAAVDPTALLGRSARSGSSVGLVSTLVPSIQSAQGIDNGVVDLYDVQFVNVTNTTSFISATFDLAQSRSAWITQSSYDMHVTVNVLGTNLDDPTKGFASKFIVRVRIDGGGFLVVDGSSATAEFVGDATLIQSAWQGTSNSATGLQIRGTGGGSVIGTTHYRMTTLAQIIVSS